MDQDQTTSTNLSAGSNKPIITAEEKALILAESFGPGAKVADIAARHGINPKRLVAWRKKARDAEAVGGKYFTPAVVAHAKASLRHALAPIELIVGPVQVHIHPRTSPTIPRREIAATATILSQNFGWVNLE